MTNKITLFLILMVLLLSACSSPIPSATASHGPTVALATPLPPTAQPDPATAAPTNSPTSLPAVATEVPGDPIELGSTFTDTFAGYSIRYPSSWHVIDVAEDAKASSYIYSVSLRPPIIVTPAKGAELPPGASALDIGVFSFKAKTLDAGLNEFRDMIARNEPPETIVGQETWQLEGGLQAVRFWITSGTNKVPALLTVINGKTILITGIGDESVFNAIARTLK